MLTLRPYQEVGADWLAARPAGLLCDGMRLGKTPQALLGAYRRGWTSGIVICPAIVRTHWLREAARWTPELKITVESYDGSRNLSKISHLMKLRADGLILDEAHYLKNPDSQRTQAIYGPHCRRRGGLAAFVGDVWPLSGTIGPNDASEIWPHLRALFDEEMGFRQWVERFCNLDVFYVPTRFGKKRIEKISGYNLKYFDELRQRIKPHLLRRRLREVYPDLPPLAFNEVVFDALHKRDRFAPEDTTIGTHQRVGMAKVPMVAELVDGLIDEQGKVVVFAWHHRVLDALQAEFKTRELNVVRVDGKMSAAKKQAAIDAFQNDHFIDIFLGQIEACGVGIPLHAARRAVFAELPWTPDDIFQPAMRIFSVESEIPGEVMLCSLAGSADYKKIKEVLRKAQDHDALYNQ